MARRVGITEASALTGLSKYALRKGVQERRYPANRVGKGKNARMMFDMDLLEQALAREANTQPARTEPVGE